MRVSLPTFVFVLSCVLQVYSLVLYPPNSIHENEVVTVQFGGGIPPYTAYVIQYPNIILGSALVNDPAGGYASWYLKATTGTQITFAVVDATGTAGSVGSQWLMVQKDLTATPSFTSVVDEDPQTSTGALNNSAQAQEPTSTPTSAPSSLPPDTVPAGLLVGGIAGGLAALLILALLTFWMIRRSKTTNAPAVLPTANPGPYTRMEKDTATIASSQHPSTPYLPTIPHPQTTPYLNTSSSSRPPSTPNLPASSHLQSTPLLPTSSSPHPPSTPYLPSSSHLQGAPTLPTTSSTHPPTTPNLPSPASPIRPNNCGG